MNDHTRSHGDAARYDQPVDPDASNSTHAFQLKLVGWNKRVLELGAATGHMTRALVAQRCQVTAIEQDREAAARVSEIADRCIAADLNDPQTLDAIADRFDVVLAGDVLEHLVDPQRVLDQAVRLLAPGGYMVVSLPHVAHADVRLALYQGRFDYGSWGLLDDTHLRFFTLASIKRLVTRAGLAIAEMHRVRRPVFESELGIDRSSVRSDVVDEILTDPEAETYQFVFSAVRADADHVIADVSRRLQHLATEHERLAIDLQRKEADLAGARQQLAALSGELVSVRGQLAALCRTRTFRYTRWPRELYRRLRNRS